MGFSKTKEDEVQRISTSVFVTNFPDHVGAKELWHACKQYGHLVDSFIHVRRSKAGKRFGFVRFIKVFDIDRLVGNLYTVWIGSHRLYANVARFSRPLVNSNKPKGTTAEETDVEAASHPVLVLDESYLNQKDFSHCLNGKVKEFGSLANLKLVMCNEGFSDVDIRYFGGMWVMIVFKSLDAKEKFSACVAINSWFSHLVQSSSDFVVDGRVAWVNAEGVPLKMWSFNTFKKIGAKWGTFFDVGNTDEENYHSKRLCIHTKGMTNVFESFKIIYNGKVYWVRAKEVSGWVPDFKESSEDGSESENSQLDDGFHGDNVGGKEDKQGEDDVSMVPDSMADKENNNDEEGVEPNEAVEKNLVDPFGIYSLLRKNRHNDTHESSCKESLKFPPSFTPREEGKCDDSAYEPNGYDEVNSSVRRKKPKSGGMESVGSGHFQHSEIPRFGGSLLNVIDELIKVGQTMGYIMDGCIKNIEEIVEMQGVDDVVIIMGDFNEVHYKNERFGSVFNVQGAKAFYLFVANSNLDEVLFGGCSYTWCHGFASKMSKLDRFLMSERFLRECPSISAISLDRFLSDHRPILLRESNHDYGPIPFWVFHYWFEMEDFDKIVHDTWREELGKLDMTIDNGKATEEDLLNRMEICNSIQDLDKLHIMEVAQKAKVKWAVEGDENSKFYHGILNKRRNQLVIRGVMKDGLWEEKPEVVKKEFLNHFRARFEQPSQERPILNMEFPNQLNPSQVLDFEAEVSIEEIKKAVWDCGTDKAPGPDSFTFGFYKRFWGLIESDVVEAVKYFFQTGSFYKGCNSSFITLISKIPDAKLVKDFRPISLIGSLYKIITKILANWNSNNIDTIIHVLKCFHLASGLNINLGKSKLMGITVNDVYVQQAVNKIGCGVLHTPFTYLGSKVRGNMSRINAWDDIVDKLVVRLSIWKMKTLSIGGRLMLLKADSFFNGVELNCKKAIWVKWCNVLVSKEKGGLGVSSLYALNRALLFKWVWRFKTLKDLLWTRVIKAIHGDKGRIGVGSKVTHNSIWCDVVREVHAVKMQGFDILNYMQKKIGSGKDTFFWDDVWLGDTPLKYRFPRVYSLEVNKHVDVASKMSQVNLSASLRRCPRGGAEQSQMGELIALLNDVILGVMDDRWCWALDGLGEFSVASVRKALDALRLSCVSSQTRWIKEVPIKVNVLAWKVRLNCLPSRLNLSRRGLPIPSILCPMCEVVVESSSHIFFGCCVTSDIFRKNCLWWNVDFSDLRSFEDWEIWLNNIRMHSKLKKLLEGVCFVFWWHLWAYRNKLIFGVVPPLKADIF
nr:RNA-directed DNA polymerase, eukaryota, reverse transcriptase zinc-binding domain protein [Tanacetum cinerariifolium]